MLSRVFRPLLRSERVYRLLISTPIAPAGSWIFELREECHRLRLNSRGEGGYLQDALITTPRNVSIGDRVTFGGRVFIDGCGGVTVGNDCLFAYGVKISSATHDPRTAIMNRRTDTAPIVIGNNVWLGLGVVVLPGVNLADGIVVAAGSVVTNSFRQSNLVIGGVPARFLRRRRPRASGFMNSGAIRGIHRRWRSHRGAVARHASRTIR